MQVKIITFHVPEYIISLWIGGKETSKETQKLFNQSRRLVNVF